MRVHLEMNFKEVFKNATWECETRDHERNASELAVLEDSGFIPGEETSRRLVLEFKGYGYLIKITGDNIWPCR